MRPIRARLLGLGLLATMACGESAETGNAQSRLQASESGADAAAPGSARGNGRPVEDGRPEAAKGDASVRREEADAGIRLVTAGGSPAVNLSCPRGGDSAPISVVFGCDRITVVTCKDLSNVVIELADGSRQRVEGLSGKQNVFVAAGGRAIVGVWVKAGANHSGAGPGYGERFDAPAASCADAGMPPPGNPPGQPPQNPPVDAPPADACVPAPDLPCGTWTNPPVAPPPSEPPPNGPGWVD